MSRTNLEELSEEQLGNVDGGIVNWCSVMGTGTGLAMGFAGVAGPIAGAFGLGVYLFCEGVEGPVGEGLGQLSDIAAP